jgi:uncharacterized membrane protein
MHRLIPLVLLALAAGCAPAQREAAHAAAAEPMPRHLFRGEGEAPYWVVVVDEREIVLTLESGGPGREADYRTFRYAGVRAQSAGGVRRWTAGRGTAVISVEGWTEACVLRGYDYRERARVRLSGRELNGCGGPPPVVEIR